MSDIIDQLDWRFLALYNPDSVSLFEKYPNKIPAELSDNRDPAAIALLEKYPDKIDWYYLSSNPSAVSLLRKHPDNVNWVQLCRNTNPDILCWIEVEAEAKALDERCWSMLSENPTAVSLLRKHPDKIDWYNLCCNPNPEAISFLEQHIPIEDMHWLNLSSNFAAISLLERHPEKIVWDEFPCIFYSRKSQVQDQEKEIALRLLHEHLTAHPEEIPMMDWTMLPGEPTCVSLFEKYALNIIEMIRDCPFDVIDELSTLPEAIHLLEKYPALISKDRLSYNPAAMSLLESHPDYIEWRALSSNPAAIHLLEQNQDKIHWGQLSGNPAAISLLEQHPEKIRWNVLSREPTLCKHFLPYFLK